MLRHILTLIYRSALRSKTTFIINVIGLSTALAGVMLIYLWISDELSFDQFHSKKDHLFQVMENIHNENGIITRDAMPFGMARIFSETFPEVEYAATVTPQGWFPKFVIEGKQGRIKNEGKFVGKDFFNIFSYPLLLGDQNMLLANDFSMVLSERLAISLFGSATNAMGKTVNWELAQFKKKECVVTGVFKDLPNNSSDQFDLVVPLDLLGVLMGFPKDNSLGPPGPSTFLTLRPDADIGLFNKKITSFMHERTGAKTTDFFLAPYTKKYLYGKFENGIQAEGRMTYVKLFAGIALIILAIACFNFMNLATARASKRIKEIGIKKMIGARRRSLAMQHIGESVFMAFCSLLFAVMIVLLLVPQFNVITGKNLTLLPSPMLIAELLAITLVTGVAAGAYPALYLSAFTPVSVLKGGSATASSSLSETLIRKGLVVLQFTLSIVFIVTVIVVNKQVSFVNGKNLGYDRENLIYFEIEGNATGHHDELISQIKGIPGVLNASAMFGNIVTPLGPPMQVEFEGKKIPFSSIDVDYDMLETLGIKMEGGRAFSRAFTDTGRVIFNASAIAAMDIKDPVGKTITFNGHRTEIIGVTQDFHFQSLHEKIIPLVFRLETKYLWHIYVKLQGNKETFRRIEALYHRYNPGYAFDYRYLDQDYRAQYSSEKRVAVLSSWFASLAIVVSCLGLFGLATFSASRRVKEIGVRKILGAGTFRIIFLLSGDFIKLVGIAICVAIPISYCATRQWLDNFAYAIELQYGSFVVSALIACTIAVLTVAGLAIKASHTNPADSLREL